MIIDAETSFHQPKILLDTHATLTTTIKETSDRCLWSSAKWACQQLSGLRMESIAQTYPQEAEPFCHIYEFAKSLFQLKEFTRAHDVLEREMHNRAGSASSKMLFLCYYSYYMAGEKSKDERDKAVWHSVSTQSVKSVNEHLFTIYKELEGMHKEGSLDSYLSFLLGIVCKSLQMQELAFDSLIQSVLKNPFFEAPWLELKNLVTSIHDMNKIIHLLPNSHIMTLAFQIQTAVELDIYPWETVFSLFEPLEMIFPKSTWVKSQKALLHYSHRDYDEAEGLFEDLIKQDPFNLDHVDIYSNVLYVKNKPIELSNLAKNVYELDRYRPESCNVLGNYYSLRGEREKAISYFKRAVLLDPHYLSAWTLLGHEYLELKNWNAAIAAYRSAVDICPRDYRAWFGMGQAYELLRMPNYAVFYIQKAAALKPYDMRIWQALGDVYKSLSKHSIALSCYKRSIAGNETIDPSILYNIGKLYSEMTNCDKDAAKWYQLLLEDGRGSEKELEDACLFLVQFFMEARDLKNSNKYLNQVLHTEQGKVLQREVKNLEKRNRNNSTLPRLWL